ncbi:hypothetical protein CAMGR0001_2397 [Campylobacter gracilis RM3268]|uniref:Uncharacterized protein n=1 Tax=Campylobacter gracilis RM3268 TaxID=553220 RepID=C8PE47_9BACT|nr:hypothetical protein CAMGR0001_2397 [Campylobacter gracilis RM3268]
MLRFCVVSDARSRKAKIKPIKYQAKPHKQIQTNNDQNPQTGN